MFASRRFRLVAVVAMLLGGIAVSLAAARPAALAQPSALEPQAYLPIILRPIVAAITFGAAVDSNGIPTPPATQFSAGLRKLYYNAAVAGAAGQTYRLEWTLNGTRQPGIDRSGTISSNAANINGLICYTQTGTSCDNPTGTLPAGTYNLRLYLNDVFITESTATITAGRQNAAVADGMLHDARRP